MTFTVDVNVHNVNGKLFIALKTTRSAAPSFFFVFFYTSMPLQNSPLSFLSEHMSSGSQVGPAGLMLARAKGAWARTLFGGVGPSFPRGT